MIHRKIILFFSIILFFISIHASAVSQNSKSFIIKNVRIFDGARILTEDCVVVNDGKIAEIGSGLKASAGAEVIDGNGCTLLPGLIDSHVHVYTEQALKQSLVFGATTVLDMFTDYRFSAEMKKQQAEGQAAGRADIFSAGTLITAPGGHGTEYGLQIPTISSSKDAQAFVDARIAEGSDYIKIIYDDGSLYKINRPTIDKRTLEACIEASHKRNKIAVVHIVSLEDAADTIKAGADGLAHTFIDKAPDGVFINIIKNHKFFVIPTLTVLQSISGEFDPDRIIKDEYLSPFLSLDNLPYLKMKFTLPHDVKLNYSAAEQSIAAFKKESIPILAGTDSPNPGTAFGASLHRELELLVQAGLSPTEALAAATSVPAKTFNLTDRGRIQPGMRADLLLVKGNPVADIKKTRNIIAIWKQGIRVDRDAYRAAVEKQKADAANTKSQQVDTESGLISDFDQDKPVANFGYGWEISTDSIIGGKSTAEMEVTPDGANNSKGSLLVTGEIVSGAQSTWAGVMFYPGKMIMTPADLSRFKEISFMSKGDGRTYYVLVYSQSRGYAPAIMPFNAGKEWKQHTFSISSFGGIDGKDITGIGFTASMQPGKLAFQLDDVKLK